MTRQQYASRAGALIALSAIAILVAAIYVTFTTRSAEWGSYVVRFTLVVAAAALTRRFGIALPGKGFASFILGAIIVAQLIDGWQFAVLTGAAGVAIGDLLLRRAGWRAAVSTVGHLVFGTALAGWLYETFSGATGTAALGSGNIAWLAVYLLAVPAVINGTFYLELALRQFFAWSEARLTFRWEAVVYVASVALALAWTGFVSAGMGGASGIAIAVLLLGATASMHWLIANAVHADELRMVQGLAGAVATEVSIERSFARIQELTHRLVPWTAMGFARYLPDSHEMELLADTDLRERVRFSADQGVTASAVRAQRPVVASDDDTRQDLGLGSAEHGSEVLVPLFQGEQLVGLWSVRHADRGTYRHEDGELLNLLAPQLALSLALTSLVRPIVESSDQASGYARDVARAIGDIRGTAEMVASKASRAVAEAERAAGRVTEAVAQLEGVMAGVRDTMTTAEKTQQSTSAMAERAQSVRAANAAAAETLQELGSTVGTGASEIGQLRDAAQEVARFAETIGSIAGQTNLLALNATIEAARAGVHGHGFAVVAEEVRKLAAESGDAAQRMSRSAQATRTVLDRASRLLEDIAGRLVDVAERSSRWREDLDAIVEAAEQSRNAGERMVAVPKANLSAADETTRSLAEARDAAAASAGEASELARDASAQHSRIEALDRGARELSAVAERLAAGVRFMRGADENGAGE